MASVVIHGFKNDDAAREFIHWYEGQGEQDLPVWFECREAEGQEVGTSANCDIEKTYGKDGSVKQDEHGNWVMHVRNE